MSWEVPGSPGAQHSKMVPQDVHGHKACHPGPHAYALVMHTVNTSQRVGQQACRIAAPLSACATFM